MSKFNALKEPSTHTKNRAGGCSYLLSSKMKLVTLLLSSLCSDTFYRSEQQLYAELEKYMEEVKDAEFVAKALIYARTVFGMRSITHAGAAIYAKLYGNFPCSRSFYKGVIKRPDDITEILAYYFKILNNKSLCKSMQKGLSMAFDKFDNYQLLKYCGKNKNITLKDSICILHPTPIERNSKALSDIINGTAHKINTWDSDVREVFEKGGDMKQVWRNLVFKENTEYMALLRNLRNILEQGDTETQQLALKKLVDKDHIKKSMVFPFRFLSAYKTIADNKFRKAIDKALNISLDNVPNFDGKTAILLDVSGSMEGRPLDIGSMFAACLFKKLDSDIITFTTVARKRTDLNPCDSIMTLTDELCRSSFGGTDFACAFSKLQECYDRIIVLSDMQSWYSSQYGYTTNQCFKDYKKRYNPNCKLYTFDLAGLSTSEFPENNVYLLTGFSDKILDIMSQVDEDPKALLNAIDSIQL